jgi:hypothetical protein
VGRGVDLLWLSVDVNMGGVNMGGVDMAGIRMMSAGIISPMPDGKLRP